MSATPLRCDGLSIFLRFQWNWIRLNKNIAVFFEQILVATSATFMYALCTTNEYCRLGEVGTVLLSCVHTGWFTLYMSPTLLIIHYGSLLTNEVTFKIKTLHRIKIASFIIALLVYFREREQRKLSTILPIVAMIQTWTNRYDKLIEVKRFAAISFAIFFYPFGSSFSWTNYLSR